MGTLFHQIYIMPLAAIVCWIILLIILWADLACYAESGKKERFWIWLNRILLVVFVLVTLKITVFSRNGSGTHIWQFFGKIRTLSTEPEYYREMLMNIFLFVPFGLAVPFAMMKKTGQAGEAATNTSPGIRSKTFKPIRWVILFAFILSVLIELAQFALSIGVPELEDIICNTLGAAIGTLAFVLWRSGRFLQ